MSTEEAVLREFYAGSTSGQVAAKHALDVLDVESILRAYRIGFMDAVKKDEE